MALVRITTLDKKVVVVSPRLTRDQEIAARILACTLAAHGMPFVMVTYAELLALLQDSAA